MLHRIEVCYAVFGRVIEGLDVLMGFEEIDRLSQSAEPHRILKVTVLELKVTVLDRSEG